MASFAQVGSGQELDSTNRVSESEFLNPTGVDEFLIAKMQSSQILA